MNRRTVFAFVCLFAAAGCSASTEPTPSPSPPPSATAPTDPPPDTTPPATVAAAFSEKEVQTLFDERCTHCHSQTNDVLDLTSFVRSTVGVATGGPTRSSGRCGKSKYGTRIVAGDRNASLLWHKVKGTHDCGAAMPYDRGNTPLDATELERLGLYIDGLRR